MQTFSFGGNASACLPAFTWLCHMLAVMKSFKDKQGPAVSETGLSRVSPSCVSSSRVSSVSNVILMYLATRPTNQKRLMFQMRR